MQSQNDYLREFLEKWSKYVSEILMRAACADENRNCVKCGIREGSWRCRDCIGNGCHCIQCFREVHWLQPFHRVEHWNGDHFDQAWLCQVGVEIHLGHGGKPCPNDMRQTSEGVDAKDEDDEDGISESGDQSEWEDELFSEHPTTGTSPLPELKGIGATLVIDASGLHQIHMHMHPCCCQGALSMDLQCL